MIYDKNDSENIIHNKYVFHNNFKANIVLTIRVMSDLKKWSLLTSNHALPKLANSSNKFKTTVWSIAIILNTTYCIIAISLDIHSYFLFKTNTNVYVGNDLATTMPTISLCSFSNEFHVNLTSCQIKQAKEVDFEECQWENFYRARNDCFTFDSSLILFTNEDESVGLHFTFKNDLEEDNYFVVIHENDNIPKAIELNRHAMPLFSSKCKISENKYNPLVITYKITERLFLKEKKTDKVICADSWDDIDDLIIEKTESSKKNKYNQELCIFTCLDKLLNDSIKCNLKCPFECTSSIYIVKDSSYCDSSKITNETEALVRVYYKNLFYTKTKETLSLSVSQLISSIG